MINPSFWKGKRVFVTGHTGFKGGWICLWLKHLGVELETLSIEQAKYIGVNQKGPFKPEYYRY